MRNSYRNCIIRAFYFLTILIYYLNVTETGALI